MLGIDHIVHGHRAAALGWLGTVAYLALAAWGVVNLTEADWFVGALFLGCALVGLPALASTVRRMRRVERRRRRPTGAPRV